MQSAISTRTALRGTERPALGGHTHQALLATPARRRAARPVTSAFGATTAFGAAAAAGGGGFSALQGLTSVLGFALAAAWVGFTLQAEKDAMEREGRRECATCGGTGVVPCICLKWSDKDVGCGACAGSGRMACSSCGGGGMAVPIEARAYVRGQQQRLY